VATKLLNVAYVLVKKERFDVRAIFAAYVGDRQKSIEAFDSYRFKG
jgi:hypothetical protein